MEKRDFRTFEIRAMPIPDTAQPAYRVEGYAAKFNEETTLYEIDGVKYNEVILSGAFSGARMQDVVMNYNHGGKPVARTKNGTLNLSVDSIGLRIEADLSGTDEGRRLFEEIQGGYIDKMSFAFTVRESKYDKKLRLRSITAFERIFDVAAVDIPAYDGTNISARNWAYAEAEREKMSEKHKKLLKLRLKLGGF